MVWDSLCGPDLLDTSGPYSMDFTVHRSTREYVTPSRDLHVPGPTTLTGNDLPIKGLFGTVYVGFDFIYFAQIKAL